MKKFLSISEINLYIKNLLESDVILNDIWVIGEISNVKFYPKGGQVYFTLSDGFSQINAVMYESNLQQLKFKLTDGLQVMGKGKLKVFHKKGSYNLQIAFLTLKGEGMEANNLDALKQKLLAEGLFAPEHKKIIPKYPEHVVLITAFDSAAMWDFISIAKKALPFLKITVVPAIMQGEKSSDSVISALNKIGTRGWDEAPRGLRWQAPLTKNTSSPVSRGESPSGVKGRSPLENNLSPGVEGDEFYSGFKGRSPLEKNISPSGVEGDVVPFDLIILMRGGGASEDLSSFNDEKLVRKIFESQIPIISAIGHEVDFTLTDFVSDLRLPTPSAAANYLVAPFLEFKTNLNKTLPQICQNLIQKLTDTKESLKKEIFYLQKNLISKAKFIKEKTNQLFLRLQSTNPLHKMLQGYSITRLYKSKKIIKSTKQVQIDDLIISEVSDGKFYSKISEVINETDK